MVKHTKQNSTQSTDSVHPICKHSTDPAKCAEFVANLELRGGALQDASPRENTR